MIMQQCPGEARTAVSDKYIIMSNPRSQFSLSTVNSQVWLHTEVQKKKARERL